MAADDERQQGPVVETVAPEDHLHDDDRQEETTDDDQLPAEEEEHEEEAECRVCRGPAEEEYVHIMNQERKRLVSF